jgi:hypothetical protein
VEVVVDAGVASWGWLTSFGLVDFDADVSVPIAPSARLV